MARAAEGGRLRRRVVSGCTAESEIDARFFGDELGARPQMMAALYGRRLGLVTTAARAAHPGRPPAARAAAMARSAVGGLAEFRRWAATGGLGGLLVLAGLVGSMWLRGAAERQARSQHPRAVASQREQPRSPPRAAEEPSAPRR